MKIKDNVIYFKDDDELTDYCLKCQPYAINDAKSGLSFYDYDWTEDYYDALENNMKFNVLDKKSRAMKNGKICKGIITKPIQNLYRK